MQKISITIKTEKITLSTGSNITSPIEIVTPAPQGSLHGNRITALRWQDFLEKLGYAVAVTESWSGEDAAMLIALHAYRSYSSIMAFHEQCPDRPIVLVLTGTDLYRDMAVHGEVLHSMEMADQLIILQSSALDSIPAHLRHKARVIYQSVRVDTPDTVTSTDFPVIVIGHLREEKDPFCIARSLPLIPFNSKIKVLHLGMAMNEQMERTAKVYSETLARYQWIGEVSHVEALKALSQSRLMVISSRMEGGAHVVSEAIALGVPVIASDIPGNRGLLGDDYLGYYPVGDEVELASLLYRAETMPDFYSALKKQIDIRRDLVSPDREMQSIQELMIQLLED
ncbi:TIGR04348 family glycosyltransferase [Polynucleobacter sp. JS-Mosq-20-D10]|uniref:selenoneine biosynthesis selenosugar synthase SenB n=1 Tax=Polynucleobacter sp. JS-Mosq-20-D10 TaxID=2576922 RepID=UPI001BFE523C|nr:selenoneine biosynthesis selenosugar synthase SenB [Polynucleobacter sp. JS-Mosq-20-D10]QWE00950.1 TIGR04348 family glycosyltransferase [Polynucleobacter sp. JS-Mosq-20-D10]